MKKLFIVTVLTFILMSCSAQPSEKEKEEKPTLDYDLIEDRIIEWDDVFKQEENAYLVYFYSETCGHCKAIKQDVLTYYLKNEEIMYFVKNPDKDEYFAPTSYKIIGISTIEDLRIYGVPGLLEIVEHEILNYHFGEKQILDYLTVQ